ncbi:hypothetical protein AAJP47_12695 [Psychrobacter sp. B38]|uniref:PulJ/GspJ family protein n=1 Tax=Psychrobacter sp. B38 TaxID=3143538 RepID=UPI003210C13F
MMRHQAGATLISLLVGMLISMLCLLGVLSAYRTMVKTGVVSRVAATHDAELQNGLTTSHLYVQNAGFGLEGQNNLLIATISINSQSTSALLWRYKDNGSIVCQGLADIQSTDSKRNLILLENNTSCNSTQPLNEITWLTKSTLAHLEDYSSDHSNPQQVNFVEHPSACTPFGALTQENPELHPLVTISAKTSTQSIAGLDSIQVPLCLLNITS